MIQKMLLATVLAVFASATALAADVSGKWKAEIDTPMGVQHYTYDFHMDGIKVTGIAASDRGETQITEGRIEGDTITFVEALSIDGNEIRIVYTGEMEGDQIKFTRKVGDFATEKLIAKRVKQ